MLAIVSPGQGAQKPGFLSPWLEDATGQELLEKLSTACGQDLVHLGTEADAETIKDTAIAQPLLVAAGILAANALAQSLDTTPQQLADVFAGHSVGEVTAAAVSGVLSSDDAMQLVKVRSQAMAQAAASAEPTSMIAVIGGDRAEVLAAIADAGLFPANINSKAQVVAAGSLSNCKKLQENPPAKARLIPLSVAGAFHTPYMESAQAPLAEFVRDLDDAQIHDPARILLSNRDGKAIAQGNDFLNSLVLQVANSVNWQACMDTLGENGVTGILELTPAGTLTGMAKRDLKGVELFNFNSPEQLTDAAEFVKKHSN